MLSNVEAVLQGSVYALRQGAPPGQRSADEAPSDSRASEDPSPKRYTCAACRTPVAHIGDEIEADGRVRHTRANPHGYVHTFVTVARCENVVTMTPPSTDFSWFDGYAWRVLACARCGTHLGWRFESVAGAMPPEFFGLLLNRISLDH